MPHSSFIDRWLFVCRIVLAVSYFVVCISLGNAIEITCSARHGSDYVYMHILSLVIDAESTNI